MLARFLTTLLALAGGASATLAFSPFNLLPFAILSPAILFALLRNASPKQGFWRGWGFGLAFFGAGTSWVYVSINTYGGATPPLAALLTFLFCGGLGILFAIQGWLSAKLLSHRALGWLGLAAIWVLFEWLRSWFLTGFPWLYLGYSWLGSPVQNWAPVLGVWGLSLITAITAAGLTEAIAQFSSPVKRSGRSLLPLAPGVVLMALSLLLPTQWTHTGKELSVALVQPDIPQLLKWRPEHRKDIIQRNIQLSQPYRNSDLIVWPETAIPALFPDVALQMMPFLDQLERSNSVLISGLPTREPNKAGTRYLYHNSMAILSSGSGVYHKQRLVPFGEYVPLEQTLRGLIEFFNLPRSAFSLPTQAQQNLTAHGLDIAGAICYEIAYPELVRKEALNADLILTISNDTWFGRSLAPEQHQQLAQMRALENGRWVLRATNNGHTALISPLGKIDKTVSVDEPEVLQGKITAMQGHTPYQQAGVWPALLSALLLLAGARLWRRR